MTMIEVLLSVSILTMLMAVTWGGFNMTVSSQQRMVEINERLHGVNQGMHRMVREISMAYMTTHGQEETQLDIRYKTGFYGENDRVDFTSLGHVRMFRDDKVGDQAEISYYVKSVTNDDGETVDAIVRREDAPIDDDPQSGGIVMVLVEDVKSFEIEYWDDEKAEVSAGADGWVSSWDTESSEFENRLPSRVKITFEIVNPANRSEDMTITTQAEVHMTDAIDF